MRWTELGRTGVRVPVIGQGTWRMGEDPVRFNQEVEALRTGIESGMTLIDTAEAYADGGAERVVAEAVKDCRDKVFIVTKVWPTNASYEGTLRAAADSAGRLGAGPIDLYLLHWPSAEHPISETMRAMKRLVEDGTVRYVGVSNFPPALMREAEAALEGIPLVCNQVAYHLKNRIVEKELLPACREAGVTLMAHSPFGQGDFPEPGTPGRAVLDELARAHGKSPRQIALNRLIARGGVIAIPKSSDPGRARENAAAADFTLTEDEIARIDAAFPLPAGDFPLRRL